MLRPAVGIVSPAQPGANNGNWRTAARWARLLAPEFRARVVFQWHGEAFDVLIALHARRSAASIAAWCRAGAGAAPAAPLAVVLTGTDLYRDVAHDPDARASLQRADALVVLQDHGVAAVPAAHRAKTHVIYQSGTARRCLQKTTRHLRALMVGHLREEKSPATLFAAARLLRHRQDVYIDHIGAALDRDLGRAAQATARACPRYRWLRAVPHDASLRRIQRAHVLVHASRIEGGAHVILEAVRSGTPVLASDIPGNRGMLGDDYDGYFPPGDAPALARLLERCRDEPRWLAHLRRQCRARAPLFTPQREAHALRALVRSLLCTPRRPGHATLEGDAR